MAAVEHIDPSTEIREADEDAPSHLTCCQAPLGSVGQPTLCGAPSRKHVEGVANGYEPGDCRACYLVAAVDPGFCPSNFSGRCVDV